MTTNQYINDIICVTNYLRKRFGQDKIYLMGHSFGTYVGLNTVNRHPEYYKGYIAMSQNCNQKESEMLAYDYMLEQYKNAHNKKMVKKFELYSIHDSEEEYNRYFSSSLRDTAMHDLGVGTMRKMHSVISGIFFPSLRFSAYSQSERINMWKGKKSSMSFPVVDDGIHFDAFKNVPEIKIPIYFLGGKYDYTCCYSLQKKYYEMIKAPKKEFYTFENSAHSPLFEEPEKALKILKK